MAPIANQTLHDDSRRVGLERHAVIAVVNHTIHNDDIRAAIRIPAIRILRLILALTGALNTDAAKHNIAAIRNNVVPLRAVAQIDVGDGAAVQTNGAEQDGPQDVDVGGVQVPPGLALPV